MEWRGVKWNVSYCSKPMRVACGMNRCMTFDQARVEVGRVPFWLNDPLPDPPHLAFWVGLLALHLNGLSGGRMDTLSAVAGALSGASGGLGHEQKVNVAKPAPFRMWRTRRGWYNGYASFVSTRGGGGSSRAPGARCLGPSKGSWRQQRGN